MNDWQLIQDYVERHSDSAFRLLVERYTNLVYSAALRQSSQSQLAEEITQTVFILLAQKAKSFRSDVILSGWLFRTTRFVANRAVRTELRRQRREEEAHEMQQLQTPDAAWLRMAPSLDEALAQLSETDRNAIVLRYLQGQELRQVGTALGMSDEAVRKRISRGIEKLRGIFAKRGYSISGAIIVAVLSSRAVEAAPKGLAGSVAASALSATTGVAALPLVAEVLNAWHWARVRMWIAALTVLVPVSVVMFWLTLGQPVRTPDVRTEESAEISKNVSPAQAEEQPLIAADVPALANGPKVQLKVLARDNDEPVRDAQLVVRRWMGGNIETDNKPMTDEHGLCVIPYDQSVGRLDVGIRSSGWGARFVTWTPGQNDPVPAEYTLYVERLTNSLSGILVDSDGNPVSGAKVLIQFWGTGDASNREMPRERVGLVDSLPVATSDAAGRWVCMVVPTEHDGFQLTATHPNFASTSIAASGSKPRTESEKNAFLQMLAGTLVTRMQSSFKLSGRVMDQTGLSIAGAVITEGIQKKIYKTDATGWFEVPNLEEQRWKFTVSAENFAPKWITADVFEGMEPLEIRLRPGATLRLRTVDEEGNPVEGITVGLEQWGSRRHVLDWKAKSDEDGKIEWRSAPSDAKLDLYAVGNGYCYTRDIQVQADGEEKTIKMRRSLELTVLAVDAETGTPIREFKAFPGYGDSALGWERLRTVYAQDGKATVRFEENKLPWYVRVEANGYAEGTSLPLAENASGPIAIEMKRWTDADVVRGVVTQPNGNPATGADVALCTLEQRIGVELVKHGLKNGSSSILVKTGSDGSFEFPPNASAHTLIAAHPSGFARVRLARMGEPLQITLQPWGRVQGKVNLQGINKTPISVVLSDWASSQYNGGLYLDPNAFSASVNKDGSFEMETAPEGRFYLSVNHGKGLPKTHHTPVTILPGRSAQVELGFRGNQVTGQLVSGQKNFIRNWPEQITAANLRPLGNSLRRPTNLSAEDLKLWEVDFWQSEEGHKRLATGEVIQLVVKPDGTFHGHGVRPGNYRLSFWANHPVNNSSINLSEDIVIPEQNEGDSAVVFDLGERVLQLFQKR